MSCTRQDGTAVRSVFFTNNEFFTNEITDKSQIFENNHRSCHHKTHEVCDEVEHCFKIILKEFRLRLFNFKNCHRYTDSFLKKKISIFTQIINWITLIVECI